MANPLKKMKQIENALTHHQHIKLEGIQLDMQTANAIMTVYRQLDEPRKRRFRNLPLSDMGRIAWKLVR